MVFASNYEVMGQELVCTSVCTSSVFNLEKDLDNWIRRKSRKQGWRFHKVDTYNQIGFPDILLIRDKDYMLIESKRLKRVKLTNILNNLTFEPGQIPFLLQSCLHKNCYMLAVCRGKEIGFIGLEDYVNTDTINSVFGV